ncbi:hypothetical protein Q73_07185 [Bacillus coahuilensis m2-6]|uniref:fluoride efflux transporter CrcB n=2 Tax=Bacillus coahuilensis TaxID=408580 RepID=UPI0007505B3A|nr:fluoride efflux transporter CrcB [Bacillus coahuilensis]KUP08139.1 hypothetical protein Q73_07185 [Bacillus coahuilensis m2-6]
MNYLLVSLGGGLGAISRYALSVWINNYWTHDFPLNTWIINCVGSFLLGISLNLLQEQGMLFLGVGFLGGFTTFSTMEVEAATLLRHKKKDISFLYLLLTLVFGLISAYIGIILGEYLV